MTKNEIKYYRKNRHNKCKIFNNIKGEKHDFRTINLYNIGIWNICIYVFKNV